MGTDPLKLRARVQKMLARINISASVEEVIQIDTDSMLPYMQPLKLKNHAVRTSFVDT